MTIARRFDWPELDPQLVSPQRPYPMAGARPPACISAAALSHGSGNGRRPLPGPGVRRHKQRPHRLHPAPAVQLLLQGALAALPPAVRSCPPNPTMYCTTHLHGLTN
eukprot:17611-Prorocentrum_minimum.AAC.1